MVGASPERTGGKLVKDFSPILFTDQPIIAQFTLNRHQLSFAQGRVLLEPGSGKIKVNLNCSCQVSWPAVGRIAL